MRAEADTLERELRGRFTVREETFSHGAFAVEVLVPRAADELIDEAEFAADERLPYWAELWPSAKALARHLLEAGAPPGRALELGCGVALPSLALRWLGAEVLATDYYADALRFARANAGRNGLAPLATALLDWRSPPPGEPFALVLAADVLYEPRNAESLAALLPRVVAPGGRFLLADPGRTYLADFSNRMHFAGWRRDEADRREEVSDPATGAVSTVRVFAFTPR
ncbi:MAG TPA: methyltransferase domain-containing protein [Longimicrobiaceae bacterium]|nr:methyltransferase domain-containing protein [Longimicrobiaceae bacterium]